MVLDRFSELKKELEYLTRESDRASGALDALRNRLKDEFGCESVSDAKLKLAELEREVASLEAMYKSKLAEFKKKYGHLLQSADDS